MTKRGRGIAGGILRRIKRTRKKLVRLDQEKILSALRSFALEQDRPLLVHSSLSACGYMTQGSATVIDALQTWMDDTLLALPTHTWSYPDATGVAPIYDYQTTPSVVGAITNYYRTTRSSSQPPSQSFHSLRRIGCPAVHREPMNAAKRHAVKAPPTNA